MWKQEILAGMFDRHEYNVNGTSPNGSNLEKQPINPDKCLVLRKFVEGQMPHGVNVTKEWAKVVTAINKRINYLGNKTQSDDQVPSENDDF